MNILELPFDVYQRYKIIEQAVNSLRYDPHQSLRILDAGGHPGPILGFLPQDAIMIIDKLDCDLPNYQKGDVLALPFKDESFDVVTSVDVLEHIPPEGRERFLRELWRVSKGFVLLAAPFGDPQVDQAEEILFEFIKAKLDYEHNFLREHRDHGLPDKTNTLHFLQGLGAHTFVIPNGHLSRWLPMMTISYYMDADAQLKKVGHLISSFYNQHYYSLDNCEPCYRYLLVASKRPLSKEATDRLQGLVSSSTGHDPRVDFSRVLALIQLYNMDFLKQKDKVLQEKEFVINDLTKHAGNLEKVLQGKEMHIKSILEHGANLENIIRGKDAQIHNMEVAIGDRDQRIQNLEGVLHAKAQHIQVLQEIVQSLKERVQQLGGLHSQLGTTDSDAIEEVISQINSDLKTLLGPVDNITEAIRQRDERIQHLEKQVFWLKNFESKVKGTLIYRLYRALRLHKLFN